jgi:phage tail-like protein
VADPGSSKQVFGNYHYKLEIPDVDDALLFFQVTPPSLTVDGPDFKTWDANGNPQNSIGGGRQPTWSEVQLSRGIDSNMSLWQWIADVKDKGATDDTKKDIKITAMDSQGNALHVWNLQSAIIKQYGHSGANAQTNEVLVENVTLKFEDATLEAG